MNDFTIEYYLPLLPLTILIIIITIIIIKAISSSQKKKEKKQRILNTYPETIKKYYNILNTDPTLNEKRLKNKIFKKNGTILIILGVLFFPLQTLITNQINMLYFIHIFSIIPIIICAFGVVNLSKAAKIANEYEQHYKLNIMKKAIKEYNPKLEYFPNGSILEPFYRQAHFENYDRYHSEDKIIGTINNNEFVMADVHVQDKRKDSDGNTYYVTLFRGPVAIVTLPEYVNLNLSIVNNKLTKQYDYAPKIEIDNSIFEDVYDIFSNNQITAMRILTPAITNKILDLYRKYDFKFEVKIQNNLLFFRFHCGQLFVPNIKDIEDEVINIAQYFEILKGIEEMMTEFIKSIEFLKNK